MTTASFLTPEMPVLLPRCDGGEQRARSSHGGIRGHETVPMSAQVSYHWVTAGCPVGMGMEPAM